MAVSVLIIDDDLDLTGTTSDVLESHGFQTITASNGAVGFEKARKEKPSLILLDIMIENAGAGLDVARQLRDDPATADIPVVILTGIRRADQLLSSYAPEEMFPNVKVALEKPVEPEKLIEIVNKYKKAK